MFDDELIRAIRTKFAPDIMEAIKLTSPMEMLSAKNEVRLPLRADVKMLFERDLAAFVVHSRVRDATDDRWLNTQQLFATESLRSARGQHAALDYLFDSVRRDFTRALANGELDRLINRKGFP